LHERRGIVISYTETLIAICALLKQFPNDVILAVKRSQRQRRLESAARTAPISRLLRIHTGTTRHQKLYDASLSRLNSDIQQ
jgi:hypothetical protein